MAGLRTEFAFTLPKGYVDADGALHRDGVMRLATARDEIEPLRDRSTEGPDDPYPPGPLLARVTPNLGTLGSIGAHEVEGLFAADLAFLQDLYGIINFGDPADVAALQASVAPAEQYDSVDSGAADTADDEFGMVTLPDEADLAPQPSAAPPARSGRGRGRIEEVTSTGTG